MVTRNSHPIDDYTLKHKIDPGISFTQRFAGFEACIAAGLDIYTWNNNEYPIQFMADVMEWHRLHGLINTHIEDAAQRKQEALSKRRGRK